MNFPEFLVENWKTTAGLLGAIAWPAALVAVAVMFRSEAKNLLGRLKSFSGAGIAAQFEDKLERLEAERTQTSQSVPESKGEPESSAQKDEAQVDPKDAPVPAGPPDILESVVVRANPVGTVMEAWRTLEVLLRAVYVRKFPREKYKHRTAVSDILSALKSTGEFPLQISEMLLELYRMRNIVAHTENVELTPNQAIRYSSQASDVRRYLERILPF